MIVEIKQLNTLETTWASTHLLFPWATDRITTKLQVSKLKSQTNQSLIYMMFPSMKTFIKEYH